MCVCLGIFVSDWHGSRKGWILYWLPISTARWRACLCSGSFGKKKYNLLIDSCPELFLSGNILKELTVEKMNYRVALFSSSFFPFYIYIFWGLLTEPKVVKPTGLKMKYFRSKEKENNNLLQMKSMALFFVFAPAVWRVSLSLSLFLPASYIIA